MCQPGRPCSPRRRPRRLTRLGRLPEREVHRAALGVVDVDPRTGRLAQLLDRAVRQRAVAVEGLDREVHALPGHLVRMTRLDELADEREHALDVLGGTRAVVGIAHVQLVHLVGVDALELGRDLGLGPPFTCGSGDDLVLDVGDVAHVGDVEPGPLQVAADGVERDRGARVADVRRVVTA